MNSLTQFIEIHPDLYKFLSDCVNFAIGAGLMAWFLDVMDKAKKSLANALLAVVLLLVLGISWMGACIYMALMAFFWIISFFR